MVSLNNCHFGEGGAYQISHGIGFSPVLTSLSLAGNEIGDSGAEEFIDPLYMSSL